MQNPLVFANFMHVNLAAKLNDLPNNAAFNFLLLIYYYAIPRFSKLFSPGFLPEVLIALYFCSLLQQKIKRAGIVFTRLPDEEYDQDIMGSYSGAGVIFGVTGGVMEAALRTAYYMLEGKEYGPIEFHEVRGFTGIKEASLKLGGMDVNIAVTSGMKNAKVLLDDIRAGKSKYQFIEIMCCPGGCINGGGMPYIRQSHNNPQVKELYEKYLGEPNSHLAHELLHTSHKSRKAFE